MSAHVNESIKKLDEKIAQLQAQKKAIESKQKAKQKKEHERRLFEFGKLVEKHLNPETPEQLEEFLSGDIIKSLFK